MLKPGRVWQEETFTIEKSGGCQGGFFVFSIFVFFGRAKNLSYKFFWKIELKARKANKEQLLCQILRNFTEGNSRNVIRIFLFFPLKNNYVIRIETRQDRYVGMRKFSNLAVLLTSDSTMAVSSKDTQDLSVQIVFFTFSFEWFLCFYFWAVIWAILLTCSLVCMSLRQLARTHY